jgi:hypothetical protein
LKIEDRRLLSRIGMATKLPVSPVMPMMIWRDRFCVSQFWQFFANFWLKNWCFSKKQSYDHFFAKRVV